MFAVCLLTHAFSYGQTLLEGIYYELDSDAMEAYVTSGQESYTGEVVIPEAVTVESEEYAVTAIQANAFDQCAITAVTIPGSVATIGNYAFRGTSLTAVTIPDGVTTIGNYAFQNCASLAELTLSGSVTSIGNYAFQNSPLLEVTIPDGVTTLGKGVFYGCSSLEKATVGSGVTSFGDNAFQGCTSLVDLTIKEGVTETGMNAFNGCTSLKEVVFPEGFKTIGGYGFYKCSSLASVTIPDSVTSIGMYTFGNCTSLTSLDLPSGLTSIVANLFYGCTALEEITIPDGVTSIGLNVFYNCSSLVTVTIGSGVTLIYGNAFANCTALTDIYSNATTPPALAETTFSNVDKDDCVVHVPDGCVEAYSTADYWEEFINITDVIAPVVITLEPTDITTTKATLHGYVEVGSEELTDQGFCICFYGNLSAKNFRSAEPDEDGNMTLTVNLYMPGTEFAVLAYATTASGTIYYGEALTFFTAVQAPAVTTLEASDITSSTATLNGQVEAGSEEILSQGFEYRPVDGETQTAVAEADDEGNMALELSDLEPETAYTFRAYANTESGTVYGEEMSFTTAEAGIDGIVADGDDAVEVARYDLNGRLLSAPQQGVNIVRYSDGSTVKVIGK